MKDFSDYRDVFGIEFMVRERECSVYEVFGHVDFLVKRMGGMEM